MVGKRILLVEGNDDIHVFKHICGQRQVGELDGIKSQEGVERLLDNLPVHLKASELEALGVVLDADTDLDARWTALRDRLSLAGYCDIPALPLATGTILYPPMDTLLPRFGVWVMPDNQSRGILEDFLRFMVPQGPLFDHVTASVASIPAQSLRFTKLAEPKAIIHTWLAWQERPGEPLGRAISAKYLDPTVRQADVLVDWLKRLFFP